MLIAFIGYLLGVFTLGWIAHRYLKGGPFVTEYFLGNRQLGAWVLALSFAATAMSGGTFMGFPALIYSNGWVMALWIASYMIVPLVTMVTLGKRINQASRLTGSITIPDLLRDRYQSPALGLLASLVLVLFLGWNLVAQFKAGGLLILEAWREPFEAWGITPGPGSTAPAMMVSLLGASLRLDYLLGLLLFVTMVVAYTTYGGFWGVTLTDILEGLVMFFGAVLLAILAYSKIGGLQAANTALLQQDPALVFGPGPHDFLPLGMAVSFFFMWTIIGIGQPGQMVRLMSFRDTTSLKRAICVCAVYYAFTYCALVVVFICARALYPPSQLGGVQPDQIMPFMIRQLASPLSPILAGFLLAAPYAAIMSTVAAYLLIISSSLVRDLYQRFIDPRASSRRLKLLSYAGTAAVGLVAMAGALDPPDFLQKIIVSSNSGLGVALLAPVSLGLYWRRANRAGALGGMLGGALCHLMLYQVGWSQGWSSPWCPLGLDPLMWSLAVSFALMIGLSLAAAPPNREVVRRYFFE